MELTNSAHAEAPEESEDKSEESEDKEEPAAEEEEEEEEPEDVSILPHLFVLEVPLL